MKTKEGKSLTCDLAMELEAISKTPTEKAEAARKARVLSIMCYAANKVS